MNRADRAEELFRKGYNCCQSVFAAFYDVVDMSEEEALKLASPFGAGFGRLREVCGAVSGMTMVAGRLKGYSNPTDNEAQKKIYELVRSLCSEFEEAMGSIICRDLLGLEKGEKGGDPLERTEEYYQSRPCIRACRTAADIIEKNFL